MTYLGASGVPRPVVVDGAVVLDTDSPVVWFTFPGEWHDIGRFHDAQGTFTGLYANILTPVRVDGDHWHTTDLFLDLFVTPAGEVHLLDADELEAAEGAGIIEPGLAARARAEADRLVRAVQYGAWPPGVVRDWPLERARREARGTPASTAVYRDRHDRHSEGDGSQDGGTAAREPRAEDRPAAGGDDRSGDGHGGGGTGHGG